MNRYKILAQNTALVSLGNFGSKLLVFLMVRFYTEWLSPSEYGMADLLTQTVNLLLPLATLGVSDAVFRFAIDRQGARARIFTIGFWTVTGGSIALFLMMLCARAFLPVASAYLPLVCAFTAASGYHVLCAQFLRGEGKTALFATQGVVNTALMVGLGVWFLAGLELGVAGYVWAFILANFLTTMGLICKERLWRLVVRHPGKRLAAQMFRYSLPLVPAAMFWWIMNTSDRYMITAFLGTEANGLYTVAGKLPTILTICADMFMDAWQLSAVREAEGERAAHLAFYARVWRVFMAGMFLAGAILIAFAPLLVLILADEDYAEAWRFVPFLVLAMVFAAFSNYLGSVYIVARKSSLSFSTSLLGAVMNVLLNLWLIPSPLGAQGAALATCASCAVVFFVRLWNTRRYLPFDLSGGTLAGGLLLLGAQASAMLLRGPLWQLVQGVVLLVLVVWAYKPLIQTLAVLRQK